MSSDSNQQQNTESESKLGQEDLNKIQDVATKILNPNGDHPQISEYIQSTFSYIGNAMHKMQTTDDRDKTAKEIADDLTTKFEAWVKSREEDKKTQEESK